MKLSPRLSRTLFVSLVALVALLLDSGAVTLAHAQTEDPNAASAPSAAPGSSAAASASAPGATPAALSTAAAVGTPTATPTGQGMTGIGVSATGGAAAGNGLLSVSAEPSTGIATASFPFVLETARGGVQPSLALVYSSSAGNREAGWGWGLNSPVIERYNASNGPAHPDVWGHVDGTDRFRFNGEPLVPICVVGAGATACPTGEIMPDFATTGWSYFRPHVEGAFARFFLSPSTLTWVIQDSVGTTELGVPLGGTDQTAVELVNNPHLDPTTNSPLGFRWHVVRRNDATQNNTISYVWQRLGRGALPYLVDIYDTDASHHTHLAWETQVFSDGTPVNPMATAPYWQVVGDQRLTTVDVTSADTMPTRALNLVRRYHLTYQSYGPRSQLSTITLEGRCPTATPETNHLLPATNCPKQPPITLRYQIPPAGASAASGVTLSLSAPIPMVAGSHPALLDVNSDGLPDITIAGAAPQFYVSNGTSLKAMPVTIPSPVLGVNGTNFYPGATDYVKVGDWSADGNVNLLWRDAFSHTVYSPSLVGNQWQWTGGTIHKDTCLGLQNGCFAPSDHSVSVDLDGDGLVDEIALQKFDTSYTAISAAIASEDYSYAITPSSTMTLRAGVDNNVFPPHLGSDAVAIADINGDSLPDIVSATTLEWWPNMGGTWGGQFSTPPTCVWSTPYVHYCNEGFALPHNAAVSKPANTYFHDVTGDGFDDLIYVGSTSVDIYPNTGTDGFATTWSISIPISALPAQWDYWASTKSGPLVSFADMDGSGVDDLVFIGTTSVVYFDLYLGMTPGLLYHVDNGLGATTDIGYTTTAQASGAAARANNPWSSQTPQSMPIVRHISTSNNLYGPALYQTGVDYTYYDPTFNGQERLFRGFQSVRSNYSGGETVEVHYLIGSCQQSAPTTCIPKVDNPLESLRGLPVLTHRYAGGTYLSTVHNTYRLQVVAWGSDGRAVRNAYPETTDSWLYDTALVGGSPSSVTVTDVDPVSDDQVGQTTSVVNLFTTQGMEHLQIQQVQNPQGKITSTTDLGRVGVDDPITHSYSWYLPPGDTSGWRYRLSAEDVAPTPKKPGIPLGQPMHRSYAYTALGQLQWTYTSLGGALVLNRFHEDPTQQVAPSPPNAIRNPIANELVTSVKYDAYGNVTHVEGPNGACEDRTWGQNYASEFLTSMTVYANGCGTAGFTTSWVYDRGLERATVINGADNTMTVMAYDGFGQPTDTYLPDPVTANVPEGVARDHADYMLPDATHPTRRVRAVLSADGSSSLSPHIAWAYIDGFGRRVVTVGEGDTTSQWVAEGLVEVDAMGNEVATHRPFYVATQDPSSVDLSKLAGPAYHHTYDRYSRLVSSTDLDGATVMGTVVYHALSQDSSDAEDVNPKSPHYNTPTTISYDGHGRAISVLERINQNGAPANVLTSASWLATGELAAVTRGVVGGPTLFQRWMQYDALGRLVLNAEPNTSTGFADADHAAVTMRAWSYAYDLAGHLVGTADARGCGKNIGYDALGRVQWEDYSPCLKSQAPYTKPNTTTGDGTEAFYTWDQGTSSPFNAGRLVTVADRGAVTTAQYDGHGRTVQTQRRLAVPGAVPAPTLATRYATSWFSTSTTFDDMNRVQSLTTGAHALAQFSDSISYSYSQRGFVTGVQGNYGTLLNGATYDADGLLLKATLGDVARTTIVPQYDTLRRLLRVTASSTNYTPPTAMGASTYTPLTQDDEVVLDGVGNPTTIRDHRDPGAWPPGAQPIAQKTIGYDDFYRVTSVVSTTTSDTQVSPFEAETEKGLPRAFTFASQVQQRIHSQSFTYDALGNTTSSDDENHSFYDRSLGTVNNGSLSTGPNRIQSASQPTGAFAGSMQVAYDAAGNVTSIQITRSPNVTFTYAWDELGRLAHAQRFDAGQTVATIDLTYTYDAGGQRVLKASKPPPGGGATTYDAFIFPTLELEGALWNAGTAGATGDYQDTVDTEVVYLGGYGRLLYTDASLPTASSGHTHVLLSFGDRIGSTTTVIDRDTSEVVERVTYGAYGTIDSDYRPARWGSFRSREHFSGKQDDFAVGLSYFGARYYSAQLGRWMSPDPLAVHNLGADLNAYAYVSGSTFAASDPFGLEKTPGAVDPDPLQIGGGGGKAPGTNNPNPSPNGPTTPGGPGDETKRAPAVVTITTPAMPVNNGGWHVKDRLLGTFIGLSQGYIPGGMLTELSKLQPGDYSHLSPEFLHAQAGGQIVGGTLAMLQGGVATIGGGLACLTGVGCTVGAPVAAVSVAQAANGFAAVMSGLNTARAAQNATGSGEPNGAEAPVSQQSKVDDAKGGGGTGSGKPPPPDAAGAKAPGAPTAEDGFAPPKKWDGGTVRNPNGQGRGYPDSQGRVWVPTGPGPLAHGGPHWDVQLPDGGHLNVYPGGKVR